jgi:hypothetical protein
VIVSLAEISFIRLHTAASLMELEGQGHLPVTPWSYLVSQVIVLMDISLGKNT